jgi:hypothetical protein
MEGPLRQLVGGSKIHALAVGFSALGYMGAAIVGSWSPIVSARAERSGFSIFIGEWDYSVYSK